MKPTPRVGQIWMYTGLSEAQRDVYEIISINNEYRTCELRDTLTGKIAIRKDYPLASFSSHYWKFISVAAEINEVENENDIQEVIEI